MEAHCNKCGQKMEKHEEAPYWRPAAGEMPWGVTFEPFEPIGTGRVEIVEQGLEIASMLPEGEERNKFVGLVAKVYAICACPIQYTISTASNEPTQN